VQHSRGAHRHREQQRVAEPVGKERLGRGQAPVVRLDAQHPCAVGLADHLDRRVPVHRALRLPCGSRGIQPECRGVRGRVVDKVISGRARQLVEEVNWPGTGGKRGIRQYSGQFGCRRGGRLRRDGKLMGDGQETRPAVPEQLGDAIGVQHCRHRNRNRAYPQRGEVNHREVRRVRHHHQHPVLGPRADLAQAGGSPADPVVQLRVADVADRAGQSDSPPVPGGQPPVEQVLTCVEQLLHHAPRFLLLSLGAGVARHHWVLGLLVITGCWGCSSSLGAGVARHDCVLGRSLSQVHVVVVERLAVDAVARRG
jgi:hypothetical protein